MTDSQMEKVKFGLKSKVGSKKTGIAVSFVISSDLNLKLDLKLLLSIKTLNL